MKKPKPKRLSPDALDRAFRGLPKFEHSNAASTPVPGDLVGAWKKAFRQIAVSRSHLTRQQWNAIVDTNDTGSFRAQATLDLFSAIYRQMDEQTIRNHCPPWESHVEIGRGKAFIVKWSRITSAEINGRLLYYWPDRPRVELNGGSWIAAFSVHAILQMIARFDADNSDRMSITRLMHATHAEPFKNGYWLWQDIHRGEVGEAIVRALTGESDLEGYQLRACYVPIKYNGKFAVASTALAPSMTVSQINDSLVTHQSIKRGGERMIDELRKLHDKIPMIREVNRPPSPLRDRRFLAELRKRDPAAYLDLLAEMVD